MSEDFTVEDYATEDHWRQARRSGLGASDAPIILGVSPYKSPMALFAEKLEIVEPDVQTEAQRWGLAMEGLLAQRYEEATGYQTEPGGRYTVRRSTTWPWLMATLDGLVVKANGRPVPAVLELKTRSFPRGWDDGPPLDVIVQVQHQLAVTGWPWAAVAVVIGLREFRHYQVERNDTFIGKMLRIEAAFYERLRTKTPPDPDSTAATKEVLRALYPVESPGLVVNLPPAAMEWDQMLVDTKVELKRLTELKDLMENRLKAAMGEAETGVLPGGIVYTYKASERAGYTVAPTVARTLRRRESPIP
jgi:putative phage-type endonuclease